MDNLSDISTNSANCNTIPLNVSNSTSCSSVESFGTVRYGRYEFITTRPEVALPVVIILVIASVVGTVGSISTLLVIINMKHYKFAESIFMLNLVISDLYVIVVADPMSVVGKLSV